MLLFVFSLALLSCILFSKFPPAHYCMLYHLYAFATSVENSIIYRMEGHSFSNVIEVMLVSKAGRVYKSGPESKTLFGMFGSLKELGGGMGRNALKVLRANPRLSFNTDALSLLLQRSEFFSNLALVFHGLCVEISRSMCLMSSSEKSKSCYIVADLVLLASEGIS